MKKYNSLIHHFYHFTIISFMAIQLLGCGSGDKTKKSSQQKNAELYYSHGTNALLAQNYTRALDFLLKAVRITPDDSRIQNNLGMAYYFKGQSEVAIVHLRKALELDQNNSDAKNNLASIYFSQGKLSEAHQLYLSITQDLVYENQYRVFYNLGLIELRRRNEKKAEEFFLKSVSEEKAYCPANFQLGMLEKRRTHFAKALDWLHQASLGHCYKEPAPYYEAGVILMNMGEDQRALEKFESIVHRHSNTVYATMASRHINKIKKSLDSLSSNVYKPRQSQKKSPSAIR